MIVNIKLIDLNKSTDLKKELEKDLVKLNNKLIDLGKRAENYIQSYIKGKTKSKVSSMRNSEPLTKAIKLEYMQTLALQVNWGLGNIDYLDNYAPHWKIIDSGRQTSTSREIRAYSSSRQKRSIYGLCTL